jgi:hypothetical protein
MLEGLLKVFVKMQIVLLIDLVLIDLVFSDILMLILALNLMTAFNNNM